MIYNATIQWKDNQNIQDDMLIVVGIPEELIMGTFMDDLIFFYCEDEKDWESKKQKGDEWHVLSSAVDIHETNKLLDLFSSKLRD